MEILNCGDGGIVALGWWLDRHELTKYNDFRVSGCMVTTWEASGGDHGSAVRCGVNTMRSLVDSRLS